MCSVELYYLFAAKFNQIFKFDVETLLHNIYTFFLAFEIYIFMCTCLCFQSFVYSSITVLLISFIILKVNASMDQPVTKLQVASLKGYVQLFYGFHPAFITLRIKDLLAIDDHYIF